MDSTYDEATGELITVYTHGIRDYMRRDVDAPLLYGVQRNIDTVAGARCFVNVGEACGPDVDYPPHALPMVMELPRLSGASISATGVTPGAALIPELALWRPFDVRGLDPDSCVQTSPFGTIWQRNWAFVADEVDFGGDLGVQTDVLVYESESAGTEPPPEWGGGHRMERYYIVRGVGRTREGGFENERCRADNDAASCDGVYVMQNDANFNTIVAGDLPAPQFCAY